MWDLTVPGNNDHDFYVVAAVDESPVLVRNSGCASPSSSAGVLRDAEALEGLTPSQIDDLVAWAAALAGLFDIWAGTGTVFVTTTANAPDSDTAPGTLEAMDGRTGRRLWTHDFPRGIATYLQQVGTRILTATTRYNWDRPSTV